MFVKIQQARNLLTHTLFMVLHSNLVPLVHFVVCMFGVEFDLSYQLKCGAHSSPHQVHRVVDEPASMRDFYCCLLLVAR